MMKEVSGMKTYMVEVNNRFMVRLEIEGSACAAEHYFLDGFKGVWGALAFDQKTMKTDCFIGSMMHDELTTVEALAEKLKRLEDEDEELTKVADQLQDVKAEIERLSKLQKSLEEDYANGLDHYMKMRKRLNADRPV